MIWTLKTAQKATGTTIQPQKTATTSGSVWNIETAKQQVSQPVIKKEVKKVATVTKKEPLTPFKELQKKTEQTIKQISDDIKFVFTKPKIVSPLPEGEWEKQTAKTPKTVTPAKPQPVKIKPKQKKLTKTQLNFLETPQADGSAQMTSKAKQTPIKRVLENYNLRLGELLGAELAMQTRQEAFDYKEKTGKELKVKGTKIIGSLLEDAMMATIPEVGGKVKAGRNILKEGINVLSGLKSGTLFAGTVAAIKTLKEEKIEMKDLVMPFVFGNIMGWSEPTIQIGAKNIDILNAKKTLKDYGFNTKDFKSPEALKSKFRNTVKNLHPDKGGKAEDYIKFTDAFNKVTSAGIDSKWKIPDVVQWLKTIWSRKKKPTEKELIRSLENTNTNLTKIVKEKIKTPTEKVSITLPEGEQTPQDIINTVLQSGQEKTTEGKEMIKSAIEAKKTGQNIVVEKKVEKKQPTRDELLNQYRKSILPEYNSNIELVKLDAFIDQIRPLDPKKESDMTWYKKGARYEVKLSYPHSLGENGNTADLVYNTKPTIEELKKDILDIYKEEKIDINKEVAMGVVAKSGRDENIEKAIDKATKPPVEKGIKEILKQKYPNVDFFVYEKNGKISLDKIIIPKGERNKGIGSNFMKDLSDYADKTNQKIVTSPTSDFGGNKNRLIDFYKKNGFIENKGKTIDYQINETMIRQPKPPVQGGVGKKTEKIIKKPLPQSEIKTLSDEDLSLLTSDLAKEVESTDTDTAKTARMRLEEIQQEVEQRKMINESKKSILDLFTGDEIRAMRMLKRVIAVRENKGLDPTSISNLPSYKKYIDDVMVAINTNSEDVAIKYIKNELPDSITSATSRDELREIKVLKTYIEPKVKEVPRSQLPVGEGKEKLSRLEARMKDSLDNAPEEVKNLSTYNQMKKKEQILKASEYVLNNTNEALQVLSGKIEVPGGLLFNSVYVAMQNLAKGDVDLGIKLASLTSTRAGQEISILTELDKNSPINKASELVKIREDTFKKRYKSETPKKVVEKFIKKGEAKIEAPKLTNWGDIIKLVRCK